MRNRQVPRSEWFQFFDAFSRRHQGQATTMRVFSPKIGSQIEARELPLEGIVSPAGAAGSLSIHLGSAPPKTNIEHHVADPNQVWVEISEAGVEEALEIESQDGTKTVMEFRAPRIRVGVAGADRP